VFKINNLCVLKRADIADNLLMRRRQGGFARSQWTCICMYAGKRKSEESVPVNPILVSQVSHHWRNFRPERQGKAQNVKWEESNYSLKKILVTLRSWVPQALCSNPVQRMNIKFRGSSTRSTYNEFITKDVTLVSPTACFIQNLQEWFWLYPRIYIRFYQSVFRGAIRFHWDIFITFFLRSHSQTTSSFTRIQFALYSTCVLYRPVRQSGSCLEWQRMERAELTFCD
jgi:hypothetical protein